jgi:hypothetical protein
MVIVTYPDGKLFMAARRITKNRIPRHPLVCQCEIVKAPLTGPAGGANIRAEWKAPDDHQIETANRADRRWPPPG